MSIVDYQGLPDDDYPDDCCFAEYRGARYRVRLGGVGSWTEQVPLLLKEEPDLARFPDAVATDRFHVHWTVTVPRQSLTRLYRREGFGTWLGYEVRFEMLRARYRRRPIVLDLGLLTTHPLLAQSLGIHGNARDGCYVELDSLDDIEITEMRITEYPAGPGWEPTPAGRP